MVFVPLEVTTPGSLPFNSYHTIPILLFSALSPLFTFIFLQFSELYITLKTFSPHVAFPPFSAMSPYQSLLSKKLTFYYYTWDPNSVIPKPCFTLFALTALSPTEHPWLALNTAVRVMCSSLLCSLHFSLPKAELTNSACKPQPLCIKFNRHRAKWARRDGPCLSLLNSQSTNPSFGAISFSFASGIFAPWRVTVQLCPK